MSSLPSDPVSPDNRRTILIVDDMRENLSVLSGLLSPVYRVRAANSGERALHAAQMQPLPDLILLDVMMPSIDGYEVLNRLRANPVTADIPVIFVTAMDADEDEEHGLSMGAVDYITKPIRPAILMARVRNHLELKQARDILTDQKGFLESEVSRRMLENDLIKDITLNSLAMLAEKRDNETGNHLHRTQGYIEALMRKLENHPRFAAALSTEQQGMIAKAAPLHDIGKVGIPDAILLKPGKLTPEEFTVMKTHSRIGADAIGDAIQRVLERRGLINDGSANASDALSFLRTARQVALSHHEKWDGSGYPDGLAGEAIPLPGRLMALADVFDALMSKRHYKDAMPLEKTVAIIVEGRGQHFDPDIVDAFLELRDEFVAICERHPDID